MNRSSMVSADGRSPSAASAPPALNRRADANAIRCIGTTAIIQANRRDGALFGEVRPDYSPQVGSRAGIWQNEPRGKIDPVARRPRNLVKVSLLSSSGRAQSQSGPTAQIPSHHTHRLFPHPPSRQLHKTYTHLPTPYAPSSRIASCHSSFRKSHGARTFTQYPSALGDRNPGKTSGAGPRPANQDCAGISTVEKVHKTARIHPVLRD